MDPDSEDWIPLSKREAWQDLQPLPVEPGKVVAIKYTQRHSECLGYFLAVLQAGEKSKRALDLTEAMIRLNSADYTAWSYRWACVTALGASQQLLQHEQAFTQHIAQENVKNYQLWNYRRKLAQALGLANAQAELQFAAAALEQDSKNYHAWAHRQYVVAEFGLWPQESGYVAQMLKQDVRNNSAWNQRANIMQSIAAQLGGDQARLRALVSNELEFCAEQLHRAPRNESAWNYLRGLFLLPGLPRHAIATFPIAALVCQEALSDSDWSAAPALVTLELYYSSNACVSGGMGEWQQALWAVDKAVECVLACLVADPIHSPYYRFRLQDLGQFRQVVLQQLGGSEGELAGAAAGTGVAAAVADGGSGLNAAALGTA